MRTPDLENQALREELAELRARLNESENALQAIRSGAVDAIVVDTSAGEQFFMLDGAETPYREMVETMSEGAVTVRADGVILYSNQRFADMVKANLRTIVGSNLLAYCAEENAESVAAAFEQSADSVPRVRTTLVASDATRVPVNMAMRCHATFGTDSIAIVVSDLTKWEQAEVLRERAIRALRMVNACADVIIHATDEAEMLAGVCEAIAAVDGYEAIWIGPSDKVAPEIVLPLRAVRQKPRTQGGSLFHSGWANAWQQADFPGYLSAQRLRPARRTNPGCSGRTGLRVTRPRRSAQRDRAVDIQ